MYRLSSKLPYFQFARYSHFAEPYPASPPVAFPYGLMAGGDDLEDAAAAVRAAEVDAAQLDETVDYVPPRETLESMKLTAADLESMSIDEVRAVASAFNIPDRSKITEKAELIAEILRYI